MSTLLNSHLSQISLCATSLSTLPFPGPGRFTNALLSSSHDITSLIRDTEPHERALFHLAPPPLPNLKSTGNFGDGNTGPATTLGTRGGAAGRRQTTYAAARQPRSKAVAAVLGGDMYQRTREGGGEARTKGEVDVEALLAGAEKLAGVYPMPGAHDRITSLRRRHQQLTANVAHYEARVAEQTKELQALNRPSSRTGFGVAADDTEDAAVNAVGGAGEFTVLTKEDLEREEQECAELEKKKRGLEERVEGMDKDLGGLMR